MANFRSKFYYAKSASSATKKSRPTPQQDVVEVSQSPALSVPGSRDTDQSLWLSHTRWWRKLRSRRTETESGTSHQGLSQLSKRRHLSNWQSLKAGSRHFAIGQTLVHRQTEQSERDQLRQLRIRRRKIIHLLRYSLLGLLLVGGLVRFLIFRVEVRVAQFITQPDAAAYQTAIETYLAQRPFERLSFNTDKRQLEMFLRTRHPEIEKINAIHTGFLRPTAFEVTLRRAVATMVVNQQRYFVDAAGVSFQNNHRSSKPSIEIIDQSGIRQSSGQLDRYLISGRFLQFIGQAIALAAERGYRISAVTIPSGTVHQLEFRVREFDLYIKMTIDREVAEQVEDLVRSLDYLKQSGLKPQYLDIRVANKVFYK